MRKPKTAKLLHSAYERCARLRMHPANVAVGIAISLLLHGMLAMWSWHMKLPGKQQNAQVHALEVRLLRDLPPPLKPAVAPREIDESRKAHPFEGHSVLPPRTAAIVLTKPPAPATAVATPSGAAETGKHLDLAAVQANLGAIVAEVDRENRDTPVGQLHDKPLYPQDGESKIGKAILATARSDCRDKIANTGWLSPLYLLAMVADKKDSGCKW